LAQRAAGGQLRGEAVEWVQLGRLGGPYGIKGWLHVDSHTEPRERLLEYPVWNLKLASGERVQRRLREGRAHGAGLVVSLEDVADREAAQQLTGAVVEIERDALPATSAREFYRADLVGLRVSNLEGADLGTVSHFIDAPRGAVMVTKEPSGREHWVLAAPRHLKRVDLAAGAILVDWPAELD
jgi:16S rRNA processing protein RimM